MFYLKTLADINHAVAERRSKADAINQARDAFIERMYGLSEYSKLLAKHLPEPLARPWGVLPRQLASMCVEDVTCFIVCKALDLVPLTLTFVRDTYTNENHDKKARVMIPWTRYSDKTDGMIIQGDYVACDPPIKLDRQILRDVKTHTGLCLPELHLCFRNSVFGENYPVMDVSALKVEEFVLAKNKPATVFCRIRGYDRPVEISKLNGETDIRPPASWYYPLYFSWFLDGSMLLLETYENPESAVPEAKKLFEETMRHVERETGYMPLVVEIAPLSKEMLYCNKHLLGNSGAVQTISNGIEAKDSSTLDLCKTVARRVLEYHC